MTARTAALITAILALACAALVGLGETAQAGAIQACPKGLDCSHPNDGQCLEDEPCFRWSTMGNRKRGVVTLHGNSAIVGPRKFARWMDEGRIAYFQTVGGKRYRTLDRLPGDRWALKRYSCHCNVQNF